MLEKFFECWFVVVFCCVLAAFVFLSLYTLYSLTGWWMVVLLLLIAIPCVFIG